MDVLLGTIGLLGVIICGIWSLINFFRKKEYKKQAIGTGIFVICFIIGAAITPNTNTQTVSTETTASAQLAFSPESTTIETTISTMLSTEQITEQLTEHETHTTIVDIPVVANNTRAVSNTTVQTSTKTTKAKSTKIITTSKTKQATTNATSKAKTTTTKKASTPAGNLQSGQVYIPEKGKRYHYDKSCSNGNYTAIAKSSAINRGYTPCKKCAGG